MMSAFVGMPSSIDDAVALLRQATTVKQINTQKNPPPINNSSNNRGQLHSKAFAGISGPGGAGGSNFLIQTKKGKGIFSSLDIAYIQGQKKHQLTAGFWYLRRNNF
jgi:hypothetical protein